MKREYLFLCLMLSGLATNTSAQLFSPAVRYPVGQNTYSIAAADFDLDADQDLATANQDADNISILMNNGDGTFAGPAFHGGLPDARSVHAVDLDGVPGPFYAAGDVNGNCAFNGVDITYFVAFLKGAQPSLVYCPECLPAGSLTRRPQVQGAVKLE